MLAFEIHPELEARLERLAKRKKQTKDAYVRRIVLDYLEDMEDLAIAKRAWAKHVASGEKAIPLEQVMKKYGVESRIRTARGEKSRAA